MYALSELQEVTPEQNTGEFYHQLLLMNHSSPNSCFSVYNNKICLRSSRYAHGLDKDEAAMIIVDILQSAEHIKTTFLTPSKSSDDDIDMI